MKRELSSACPICGCDCKRPKSLTCRYTEECSAKLLERYAPRKRVAS